MLIIKYKRINYFGHQNIYFCSELMWFHKMSLFYLIVSIRLFFGECDHQISIDLKQKITIYKVVKKNSFMETWAAYKQFWPVQGSIQIKLGVVYYDQHLGIVHAWNMHFLSFFTFKKEKRNKSRVLKTSFGVFFRTNF